MLSDLDQIISFTNDIKFAWAEVCRCRSEIRVWGLLPGFGSHCMVRDFRECFGKSLYGRNLLLTIQNLFLLLPRDIRFSTNEGVYLPVYSKYVEGSQSSRMLMCVGKCLLTSCERIIQKKTLNPFVFTQSGWMLYYNK